MKLETIKWTLENGGSVEIEFTPDDKSDNKPFRVFIDGWLTREEMEDIGALVSTASSFYDENKPKD